MARKSTGTGRSVLTEEVADRLHSATVRLLRRLRRADERAPISAARLSALSVLAFGGPRSLSELAAAEHVSAPTMSRLIAAMEKEGFVRRAPDENDRRAIVLHATAKGRRAIQRGRQERVRQLHNLLSALDTRDLKQLDRAARLMKTLAGE